MIRKPTLLLFTLMLLCVCVVSMANATLITNGSFEDNSALFVDDGNNTMKLTPAATELTNWKITGNEIAWIGPTNPYGLTASDGSYFLDLTSYSPAGSGGVAQTTAATIIGQSYTLTFDLGGSTAYGAATDIIAKATAGSATDTFNTVATSANFWETFSMSFIADSTSTSIELTGIWTSHTGNYIGLDNVQLNANPVPEPATMMLFGLGLLGLVGVNRRKK